MGRGRPWVENFRLGRCARDREPLKAGKPREPRQSASGETESVPEWVGLGVGAARGSRTGAGGSLSKVIISNIRENELGHLDDIS